MFILSIILLILLPFALLWLLKVRVNIGEIVVLILMLLLLSSITNLPDVDNYELSYRLLLDRVIIVPGSKSTIADLAELRKNGVAQAIIKAHKNVFVLHNSQN